MRHPSRSPLFLRPLVSILAALTSFAALAQAPAGYYDTAQGLTGAALEQELHEIIDDHVRYPYTSTATDTWDIIHDADEDEGNPLNVRDLYRNRSFAKTDHWSSSNTAGWNREHSWPKSYGFSQDGSCNYPYTDVHHLFASDGSYNSARSNIPFDWAPGGTPYPVDDLGFSNWKLGSFSEGSWEVWEYRKGDVARAALYMAVRYEGGSHGVSGCSEPDLRLTDDRGLIQSDSSNNLSVAYMGMLSTLLEWHAQDPVDDRERRRNDVVFSYQGNRNPFIDHPEWVCEIWPCGPGGGNQPPVASFSFSCTDLSCSFTDLSTDSDGTIASWSWNFGDGTTSAAQHPSHTFASNGSYQVTLTVTDDGGATGAMTQTVSVNQGGAGGQLDISGWKLTQANFTYEYVFPASTYVSENGYVVLARNAGQAAFESYWGPLGSGVTFIDSANSMPVINGDEVYELFDATGTRVDGTTIAIASGQSVQRTDLCGAAGNAASWTVGSDATATPGAGAPATCGAGMRISEFSDASGSGNYVYEFVELYFDGGSGGGDVTPPAAPSGLQATAGDGVVSLDWSDNGESDLAGYHVYRSTTSGSGYTRVSAALLTSSAYSDASVSNGTTYYYVVSAEDTTGNESGPSAEASATPTAAPVNQPPVADFSSSCVDLDCQFTDLSTDADGTIVAWSWNFGDGASSTVASPSHSFAAAGSYTVTLTVTDDGGATDQVARTVTVTAPPSSSITLVANGYKVKGWQKVDLTWSGASGASIDVYRDGQLVVTTANDGAYTDDLNQKGGGNSHTYRVCETGTGTCSGEVTVAF